MRKYFLLTGLLVMFLVFTGQGCLQIGSSSKALPNGGIFKTNNSGDAWVQIAYLYGVGANRVDFVESGIKSLTFDPSDHKAMYIGTFTRGLFYSYDGGAGWFQPDQIKGGAINAVAIDPKYKCTVYVAIGGMILKTEDCNRNYISIYQESRPEVTLRSLAIDPNDRSAIYAGNSVGDVLKLTARGWEVISRLNNTIAKLIINPTDTKIIYAATQDRGVWKSKDAGNTWVELNEGLKQFGGAFAYHDLIVTDFKTESMLLSSQYGLIKTEDGGVTWKALNLLTPPNGADIKVVAVNPVNLKEIYYSTPSTFYKSVDAGEHWVTKKLPSTRPPTILMIDPVEPKIMFMGFEEPKK